MLSGKAPHGLTVPDHEHLHADLCHITRCRPPWNPSLQSLRTAYLASLPPDFVGATLDGRNVDTCISRRSSRGDAGDHRCPKMPTPYCPNTFQGWLRHSNSHDGTPLARRR